MGRLQRIGLTVKKQMEKKALVVSQALKILEKAGASVFVDAQRLEDVAAAKQFAPLEGNRDIDAMLTIGGDGTILRAVREYADLRVPFITVNRGTLGFLADMTIAEAATALPKILAGKGVSEDRAQLTVSVHRGPSVVYSGTALNEAVIAQGALARLISLNAMVGSESLTTFHADGLIVSTPTGSTAYNLAAGGPVVHPHLSATILTAINPHSFSQKPLVLPGHLPVTVTVELQDRREIDIGLSVDGQEYFLLKHGDRVVVKHAPHPVQFLRASSASFFTTLRAKLRWGEGPEGSTP